MGKRQELEMAAIRLYADGNEIPAIAVTLDVSENSLRDWKRRAGPEWDDARRAARSAQLADMEDVGARIRRSREIAAQITGSAKDQSAVGMVLNQTVQTMLYDLMSQIDTAAIDPEQLGTMSKLIANLTLALGRTEQAAARNQKTAAEIRKQLLEEVTKKVDADTKATGGVMTADRFREIIRESYGV